MASDIPSCALTNLLTAQQCAEHVLRAVIALLGLSKSIRLLAGQDFFRAAANHLDLSELSEGMAYGLHQVLDQTCWEYKTCLEEVESSQSLSPYSFSQATELHTSMLLFLRALKYRSKDLTYFPLPPNTVVNIDANGANTTRLFPFLAARMMWLEERKNSGSELYPRERRYEPLNFDMKELHANLSVHLREQYLDDSYGLSRNSLEWSTFVNFAAYLTYARYRFSTLRAAILRVWSEQAKRPGVRVVLPPIESFTIPCTEEVLGPGENGSHCYVCNTRFGLASSDEDVIELAVKSICNHVHGKNCLETWVKSGHESCPLCRQHLFTFDRVLSEKGHSLYQELLAVNTECEEFDERIDTFLYEGRRDTHGLGFAHLLEKLFNLVLRQAQTDSARKLKGWVSNP